MKLGNSRLGGDSGSGITQTEGDARYLQLSGGSLIGDADTTGSFTVTGSLVSNGTLTTGTIISSGDGAHSIGATANRYHDLHLSGAVNATTGAITTVTANAVNGGTITGSMIGTMEGTVSFNAANNHAYIQYDDAPGVDHKGNGIVIQDTVGENVSVGSLVYVKNSDGKWYVADADSADTMPAMGLVTVAAQANEETEILLHGVFRDDTWNFNVGSIIYGSIVGGEVTHHAPTGSGDMSQALGIALTADVIFFNPSPVLVKIA